MHCTLRLWCRTVRKNTSRSGLCEASVGATSAMQPRHSSRLGILQVGLSSEPLKLDVVTPLLGITDLENFLCSSLGDHSPDDWNYTRDSLEVS